MATTVEIGVTRGFTLDDPVRGVLDGTTWTLGGENYIDVTDRLIDVSFTRGKNRDLDKFTAATLEATFNNEDRYFDPVVGTALDIVPRAPIRVLMDGTAQFTGSVNDWNYEYRTNGRSKVSTSASDDFVYLARQNTLTEGTPIAQTTGARVEAVLNMFTVNWPADRRDIDTGDNTVSAQPYDGTNALEYLNLISDSEQGLLFIGKNGDLTFRDRSDGAPRSTGLVTFADDGSGIPFVGAGINYDSEYIYNQAIITSPAAGTATASNTLSQQTYGVVTYELETLCSTAAQLQDIANYVVARYAEPELRFQSLTVNLDTLPAGQQATLLALEIGDVCQIKMTPNNTGTPIDRYAQIFRIAHSVSQSRHDVTLTFDPLEFAAFILDDAIFGKLDTGKIGY